MTKTASKRPKASAQSVRTLNKRMDRHTDRCRETRRDLQSVWEMIYIILQTMDPEKIEVIAKTINFLGAKPTQVKAMMDLGLPYLTLEEE